MPRAFEALHVVCELPGEGPTWRDYRHSVMKRAKEGLKLSLCRVFGVAPVEQCSLEATKLRLWQAELLTHIVYFYAQKREGSCRTLHFFRGWRETKFRPEMDCCLEGQETLLAV